jgi:hypothetical protein
MKKITSTIIKTTVHFSFFSLMLQGFLISVIPDSISAESNIAGVSGLCRETAYENQGDHSGNGGTLKGLVSISGKSSGLPFVMVLVSGTNNFTITDRDGYFTIRNIEPGKQKISFTYFGCNTDTEEVTIVPDQITEMKVTLRYYTLREKETAASIQAQGQLAAINEELTSDNIVNAVTVDKMFQLPDANIAESLGRLPGISLGRTSSEADKVIIRGLSAQYTKVTIEGIPMISMSGLFAAGNTNFGNSNISDRSIDLSILNDDLFDGAVISKSLRADMDADALGGTINLRIKKAP